jgi:threonine dehydratase
LLNLLLFWFVFCASRCRAAQKAKGVVAFSSGNFGQGLAAAAAADGVQCTIVMPGDAPASKQARARSYGATVVRFVAGFQSFVALG